MLEWQHLHHRPHPGHPQCLALTRVGVITAGLRLGLGLGLELALIESKSLLGQPNGRLAHGHRAHTSTPNIPFAFHPALEHPSALPHNRALPHTLVLEQSLLWSMLCLPTTLLGGNQLLQPSSLNRIIGQNRVLQNLEIPL